MDLAAIRQWDRLAQRQRGVFHETPIASLGFVFFPADLNELVESCKSVGVPRPSYLFTLATPPLSSEFVLRTSQWQSLVDGFLTVVTSRTPRPLTP